LTEYYDVVVIGGGIHGVGVAQAAAAQGYSVMLLEQSALAAGTSSRSSKLIHGGLRYLESGQFSLVRECLRERALLLKLAPELVRLRPFYLPIYRHTRRRPWKIRLGLSLYDLLAAGSKVSRHSTLPRHHWERLDGLLTEDLEQVYCYPDAQTDDVALTHAVMRSAQELGAELRIPAALQHVECHAHGATVHYQMEQRAHQCECRAVVNAAGPWANGILNQVTPAPPQIEMDFVAGTHIVIPEPLTQGIYYVEAPRDYRAVFVMPWRRKTLVGTTETVYRGDPALVHPLNSEIDYLWETFTHYFPRYRHAPQNIFAVFTGVRVLPARGGSPFGRPRETILHPDHPGHPRVLTIYGGKLTAYRATAAAVMARLRPSLPSRNPVAATESLPLKPVSPAVIHPTLQG
jgi:glycerol-3-phosphate dehydrogenase